MSDETKNKRSIWQLSLRSSFIATTLFCAIVGLYVRKAEQQKRLVQSLAGKGNSVFYAHENEMGVEPPAPEWLVKLFGIDYFDTVTGIFIGDRSFHDVPQLVYLSSLECVDFDNTQITDVSPLENLKQLKELRLVMFAGNLESVAKFDNMNALTLHGSGLVLQTPKHPAIQRIPESNMGFVVYDLSPLANSSSLHHLSLTHCPGHTDLRPLSEIQFLQTLVLRSTPIKSINTLSDCENLHSLELNHVAVSDLSPLYNLDNLQNVRISACEEITRAEIQTLKAKLPQCHVVWE